jgi:hypothetical protein
MPQTNVQKSKLSQPQSYPYYNLQKAPNREISIANVLMHRIIREIVI